MPLRSSGFLVLLLLVGGLLSAPGADDKKIENSIGKDDRMPPAAAAPAAPDSVAATSAAVAVVQRVFDDYLGNIARLGNDKARVAWAKQRPEFTPAFKATFAKAHAIAARGESGGMDADPIINAQDYPDNPRMIPARSAFKGTTGTVWMQWKAGMTGEPVPVKLVQINGVWLISGIGGIQAK